MATADGYKTIEAKKGVILATGGFSSNVQMRETQVPYLNADLPTTNIKAASTGEGIYLAQAIGANTTQMSNIKLVREMVYASPEYFNILLDNGLVIRDTLARPGGHYGYRTYVTENQVGSDITNLQLEILKKTSATIELETKMV